MTPAKSTPNTAPASAGAAVSNRLAEYGLHVGDLVEDRHGDISIVTGMQTQGGRTPAIVVKNVDTDRVRRLMPRTLTAVPAE